MVDDNGIIEFADVRLDRRRAVLERNGAVVPVRPRTFALLCYLAENSNRVVSKDEILAACLEENRRFRRRPHADDRDVRRVIDERDGAVLRTIPKRGFLFTDGSAKEPIPAYALEVGEAAEAQPAPQTKPPQPKKRLETAQR